MAACGIWKHDVAEVADSPVFGEFARMPRLVRMPDNSALMSWVEPLDDGHVLKFAVQKNGQWTRQGTVAQGEHWFVNWADYHSVIAIDPSFWVAHWLQKRAGGKTYDYDIKLAISHDAGVTWREIGHPYQDKTAAEHGFVTIFPDAGEAGIVWLDGREHVKKEDKAKYPEKSGNFSLRYAQIYRDGRIEHEQVIDNNTCTCCWTAVATTAKGAVAAWRGRTDNEIRDNRAATFINGSWSKPTPLGGEHWEIAGCPVNGPALAAINNQVAAAWFTAQGERPRIRAAFSQDGGQQFTQPIDIDTTTPLGRIGLLWQNPTTAVVSWMSAADQANKKSWVSMRKVAMDGKLGEIIKVAEVSAGRETGVPQMVATQHGILMVWTKPAPEYGIHIKLVGWDELDKRSIVSTFQNQINDLFFEQKIAYATQICQSRH